MKTGWQFVSAFVVINLSLSVLAWAQAPSVMVGILEDNPGHYAGEPHYRAVRVVFHRDEEGWKAFPNHCPDQKCLKTIATEFPAETSWTIAFDGKKVGQVATRRPLAFDFYSSVGQQRIESSVAVPTIGKPLPDFSGFLGEPVYRPLVAISEPNYLDPENWKRIQLSPDRVVNIRKAFRAQFPEVTNCTKQDMEHAKIWSYRDANIRISKAYESNRHWRVVEVLLTGSECDYTEEKAFYLQLYVITPKEEIRFLDSNIWLVDAGDYDGDGKSELIFSIDDYNRGGYKIYYDDFSRNTAFEFGYH